APELLRGQLVDEAVHVPLESHTHLLGNGAYRVRDCFCSAATLLLLHTGRRLLIVADLSTVTVTAALVAEERLEYPAQSLVSLTISKRMRRRDHIILEA